MNEKDTHSEITPEMVALVVARLKTIPSNATLSIGSGQESRKASELINEVNNQTDIGKSVIESQLFFLRSLQDLPSPDDALAHN